MASTLVATIDEYVESCILGEGISAKRLALYNYVRDHGHPYVTKADIVAACLKSQYFDRVTIQEKGVPVLKRMS